jgi:predicted restriction endonuclease
MKAHIKNYLKHFDLGETDTWYCEACMREFPINNGLQIHHIIYRSHGGSDDIKNLICLCVKHHTMCHDEKVTKDEIQLIHNYFLQGTRKKFLS